MNRDSACQTARTAARNLRQLRMARGWSQRELAREAGVAMAMVTCLENLTRGFTTPMLERLAAPLGVQPWMLLRPLPCEPAPCGNCGGSPAALTLCLQCGAYGVAAPAGT